MDVMQDIKSGKGLKPLNEKENADAIRFTDNTVAINQVAIPYELLKDLIINKERVDILQRYMQHNKYLSETDVCDILGIERKETGND